MQLFNARLLGYFGEISTSVEWSAGLGGHVKSAKVSINS